MERESLARYFYNLLRTEDHISDQTAMYLNLIINFVIVIIVSYIIFKLLRYFSLQIVHKLASKTKTNFDDFLVQNKAFIYISNLVTLSFISTLIPKILIDFPEYEIYLEKTLNFVIAVVIIWLIRSILMTIKDFLKTINSFKDKPIESYIQVFMIVVWIIGIIVIFSIITGKPLFKFLTALGAFSAVLLLVFKDTILGFVASIQVTVNDTVRLGDWITMEKYGADGDVFEINLASVKVRNFDNTITTIPTYYLISDSFKNWRGMSVSGGRRIKRSILIKANSIKFLSESDVENLQKIQLITEYIKQRQSNIDEFNLEQNIDKSLAINGRNQTNFGAFRQYVDEYLATRPDINKDMMMMTRQLPPTPQGIPLEIYAFSSDKVWQNYERIMAGIFDHLLAAIPYFDLETYESPTGHDVKSIAFNTKENSE